MLSKRAFKLLVGFTIAMSGTACQSRSDAPLVATEVVVNTPIPGSTMGSAYLTLRNNSTRDISIDRIDSSSFAAVEMHETRIANGIARMQQLDRVTIPAKSTVTFERGGRHLMLMKPVQGPQPVTLRFYAGETLVLTVTSGITEHGE